MIIGYVFEMKSKAISFNPHHQLARANLSCWWVEGRIFRAIIEGFTFRILASVAFNL